LSAVPGHAHRPSVWSSVRSGAEQPGALHAAHHEQVTMVSNPARLLQRLAWAAAGLVIGLIGLGGVVRITGSGMGCGENWPRCKGEWFPPLDLPTMIEISHRWVAALVSVMVITVAAVAWWRHGRDPALRTPATVAGVLLLIQVALGAITVKLALPPAVIVIHLA